MLGLVRHARACRTSKIKAPISPERVELFCSFVACSYTCMETTVLSCRFIWVWSCMPKVLWNKKSSISLERVEWFCWFFACSYLHFVRYSLKLQKYAILGWYLSGIGSQAIRLSDVLNLNNLKIIWAIKLIFCFDWS